MKTLVTSIILLSIIASCDSRSSNSIDSILELSQQAISRQEEIANNQYSILSANYLENPERLKTQWNVALKTVKLIDECLNVVSKAEIQNKLLESHYKSTLSDIDHLLVDFEHDIDIKEYMIDSYQGSYRQTLLRLQLTTLKSDVLWFLNSFHGYDFSCRFGTQINTRDSILTKKTASFAIESPIFSQLENNHVTIDSCFKGETPMDLEYRFSPRKSFGRIHFDSIQPGEYKIFGTVKNFSNQRVLTGEFETEFEIKN